jgi:ABC-2 type transport system permease protein
MVSWMPFVFIAPVLIAFGQVYGAPWWYYPYSLAVLIPYFVIPVAISTTIAVLLMALIDPRWTRVIAFVILSLILVCIYFTIEMIASVFSPDQRNDQVLKLVNIFRQASSSWNPASWASRAIAEVLEPSGHSIFLRLSLLFCCSVSMLGVAFGCVELLHLRGYTRAKNSRLSRRSTAERKPRSAVFVGHPIMSLIQKEFRSIFRDVAQSAQVLFLGCMCLIYLMNLRFFVSLDSFPPDSRTWWQNLFFIMHCSVAAFFTTAVCTRVVFSSTSLEGRAFWILQTAPIEFRRILRAKFLFWLPPVALVSGIIFAVGAFTISGRLDFVLVHIPSSIFVSYGIVGLGVGLGAYFSDFNWDHPSQLALGLGSFFFMLGSALLVFLNVIPVWLMLQVGRGQPFVAADLFQERGLVIVLATITIGALNYLVAQTAMEQGEAALERAFR